MFADLPSCGFFVVLILMSPMMEKLSKLVSRVNRTLGILVNCPFSPIFLNLVEFMCLSLLVVKVLQTFFQCAFFL